VGLLMAASFAGQSARADEGLPLHGFADASWGTGSGDQPQRERTRGFSAGTVDLYLNPTFGDKVKSLLEITLEVDQGSESYSIDVERVQVGYAFSDAFNVWLGRFHTPYGYWNTAFHHGAQLQPSVYKPRFIDWEDHAGFMPSHTVGLWLTGKPKVGNGRIHWDLYAGNGSRNLAGQLDMNNLRNDKDAMIAGGRLGYLFGGSMEGAEFGVHALSQEVDVYQDGGDVSNRILVAKNNLNMYGAFFVWENEKFEFSSELYNFTQTSTGSLAWFAHLGYFVSPDVNVYGRYEQAKLDKNDGYFDNQVNGFSYERGLLGARFNLNPKACIKVEVNQTTIDNQVAYSGLGAGNAAIAAAKPASYNEAKVQYAISF
jgi:hypothetical protein